MKTHGSELAVEDVLIDGVALSCSSLCAQRSRDQIVPLDAFFVGNETECIEPGDLPLDYHDFEFLKCSA